MTLPVSSSSGLRPLLPGPTPPGSNAAKLHEAAEAFEAIFVRQMLAAAGKVDFGGNDLFGSSGEETFRELRDAQFAETTARNGSLGIAEAIEAQLSRHVEGEA